MDAGMAQPPQRPPTTRDRVRALALGTLSQHPDGVPDGELVMQILAAEPAFNLAAVSGYLADAERNFPGQVYRPAPGVLRLVAFRDPQRVATRADLLPEPAPTRQEAAEQEAADDLPAERAPAAPSTPRLATSTPSLANRSGIDVSPRPAVSLRAVPKPLGQELLGPVIAALVMLMGFLLVAFATGYAVWVGP